jgi:hypothetical protein
VLEQPMQDDEVHPIGSAGLAAVRARAKGAWAARTNELQCPEKPLLSFAWQNSPVSV